MRLPELFAWPGEGHANPDIEITYERVVPPPTCTSGVHVGGDRDVFLAVPGVGRFLVRDGRRVLVDPALPHDDAGLRLYVLGSVLAILCYQRGVVPFHASALVPDPNVTMRAIMVGGDSGAGKSTLAATFALQGAPILADDVCRVDTSSSRDALVIPSITRLKLWPDTVQQLDIPANALEPIRNGIGKYAWYGANTRPLTPTPLAAIYHLTCSTESVGTAPRRASGITAMEVLSKCVYRRTIGIALGQELLIARTLLMILDSTPVFCVERNPNASGRSLLPSVLLEHWRALATRTDGSAYTETSFT